MRIVPFPEVKLIDKVLSYIDMILWTFPKVNRDKDGWLVGWLFGAGFCTECYRFTVHLHDSSSQGYHCSKCCNVSEYRE